MVGRTYRTLSTRRSPRAGVHHDPPKAVEEDLPLGKGPVPVDGIGDSQTRTGIRTSGSEVPDLARRQPSVLAGKPRPSGPQGRPSLFIFVGFCQSPLRNWAKRRFTSGKQVVRNFSVLNGSGRSLNFLALTVVSRQCKV